MASSPGSRTLGFIASPPAVSRPCGLPFASVVSTFPAPSGKPKPHETSALMSIPGKELHTTACRRHVERCWCPFRPRGLRQTIRVNRRHGGIPEYIDIEEAETAEVDVETGEV